MTDLPHPEVTDGWMLLLPHLDAAIAEARQMLQGDLRGLLDLARARYYEGEKQYRRDWMSRPLVWFDQEAASEAADLIVYPAMRRVREAMEDAESSGGV